MMKKNLPELVAITTLCTLACAAQAQSNVTIYGRIDLGVGKDIGSSAKRMADNVGSRIGFRGVEDLGGGLKAMFVLEHRFSPDTGLANPTFWQGISTVGLGGAWGSVNLGRQYTAAFTHVQDQIDPFGGDTQAALREVGMRVGGITKVRVADSIRYDYTGGGFGVAATFAQSGQPGANAGPDNPVSVGLTYRGGPLFVGAGYEDPAGANDEQWNLGAKYTLGSTTLAAGYTRGTTLADNKATGFLVGATHRIGSGEILAGYGEQKIAGVKVNAKVGLGYVHHLSKRTRLYAAVGHDRKALTERTGYDLGIQHRF
jgi:predicted porin